MMPAGKYYIGDLCYVMADEEWREICNIIIKEPRILDGEFELPDGRRFAIYSTAYGDGTYHDQHGHAYSVDAGSIGCIRLDDIKYVDNFDQFLDLGAIQEFAEPFVTSGGREHYQKWDGVIRIGHVEIVTDSDDLGDIDYEEDEQ
jgi:hypothetical protein